MNFIHKKEVKVSNQAKTFNKNETLITKILKK